MTSVPAADAPSAPVRALLTGVIDYAGLFPPAELEMRAAVDNFLTYQSGPDAWALGRFVVPAAGLAELEEALRERPASRRGPIPLTVLIGSGTADDADAVERFDRRRGEHRAEVEAVEAKTASVEAVRAVAARLPRGWIRYFEVSPDSGFEPTLDAIVEAGARAKVRAGGTTSEAIPPADALVKFLAGVARRRLAFKATAGLHHPVRGAHRLTYAETAPSAVMHGYLNLLLAAAVIWRDGDEARALEALLEEDAARFRLDAAALVWGGERFESGLLAEMRRAFFHGFGSCSFEEPMRELALRGPP